jgi:hypothetical protein
MATPAITTTTKLAMIRDMAERYRCLQPDEGPTEMK